MFSQLTFRTPCPLLLSLFSLSSRLAPPTRAPHSAIGCREAVFPTRMVAEHVNHTSSDLFTECMSERGRDSATGLQQLTAEHFTQCLKEQRGWKTAAQNTLCNFVVFFLHPRNNQSAARTRHEARGRTARKRGKYFFCGDKPVKDMYPL